MVSTLLTLLVDFVGTQYYERKQGLTRASDEQVRVGSEESDTVLAVEVKERNGKVFGEEESGGMHIVGMHAHAAHHRHSHPHGQDACHGSLKEQVHGHSYGIESDDEEGGVRHVVVSQVTSSLPFLDIFHILLFCRVLYFFFYLFFIQLILVLLV